MNIYNFDQLLASQLHKETCAALSIGVFDGLHYGHHRIISQAVDLAKKEKGCKSVVITFAQNPKTLFGKNPFKEPLMSQRQFTQTLASFGVDFLVVIDFSVEFSKLTGEEFIARCCQMFRVQHVVVGENFRCGSKADTTVAQLPTYLKRYSDGATLCVPKMYKLKDGSDDSSTIVRNTLSAGRVSEIPSQLGRYYSVDLAHFPSRNIEYPVKFANAQFVQLLPPPGVYESTLVLADNTPIEVIANVDEEFLTLQAKHQQPQSRSKSSVRFDNLQFRKELT